MDIKKIAGVATTGAVSLGLGLVIFGKFFESPPIRYLNQPFPVLNAIIAQGGIIQTVVHRCNDTNSPFSYQITRNLISADGAFRTPLASNTVTLKPGCHMVIAKVSQVPIDQPPGQYYVEGTAEIELPFKKHVVLWSSVPFEIVAKKP